MEPQGKRIVVLGVLLAILVLSQNGAEAFDLKEFFKKWCVSTCGDLCELKPKDLCDLVCSTLCDLIVGDGDEAALSGLPPVDMKCSWGCVQKNCTTPTPKGKANLQGCFGSCCGM